MSQARDVMDRITAAVVAGGSDLPDLYAPDAKALTPEGEIEGRDGIVEWMREFTRAFPDVHFELTGQWDAGDAAIDEGYLIGTHTGPLAGPEGEIPPTGRQVRLRECDIVKVSDGKAREHHFYYDRQELLEQLGVG